MIDKAEAIISLGYNFYGGEDVGFTFYNNSGNPLDNPPTDAEIDAEVIRLQAEFDAQAYSRSREAEYPSIQECVHAILDDTLDALQAKRAEIKTKYPKGG